MKFVRSPNLVAYWRGREFILEEFEKRSRVSVSPLVIQLLEKFGSPRTFASVAQDFKPYSALSVKRNLESLRSRGFLRPAQEGKRPSGLAEAWGDSMPAVYYHFAARDLPFTADPAKKIILFRSKLARSPQPPLYKNYPRSASVPLPRASPPSARPLQKVLDRRETVRIFRDREIGFPLFASLIRGTWGQTAWLPAGFLGKYIAKTSPSAGARHPIECYVLAFRVQGLRPGLYHYSVQADSLEELSVGDLREAANQLASGQDWVGTCAFVCIMTAVAARSFWKYPASIGYRAMLLDAGHLGQTFSLLATAVKLGPFTTGAIQQSKIERLLNIDGVTEFPLYLCGAGIPAAPRQSERLPFAPAGVRARGRLTPKRQRPVDDKRNRRQLPAE